MDSIESKLVAQLARKFGQQPDLDDRLSYIGVDSVGMAELTVEIEREFGIKVAEDIFGVDTVRELAAYIRQRQGTAASS